jgi:hypothetical protein
MILGSCITLKLEAICSSETSVDSHRITWRYIPEDKTLDSWLNQQFSIEQALLATCFHAGFLLGFSSDPKNGGDMLLRNVY